MTRSGSRQANNFVDTHVFAKLKELRIEPSDLCTDDEFIRRVFLDACGIMPTASEVTAFVSDKDAKKREKLVDAVLARSEFTDYWALQLSDLFQNRKERDHDVRGPKGVRQFHDWLRKQVAANRPWDELARDVLTATGSNADNPAVGYYIVTVGEQRHGENSEAPESIAQAFLGTRIGCAKCHNHPLERYTQDDFYHFAAYFSRVKLDRKEAKMGPTTLAVGHPDQNQNKSPVGVSQPRTGMFMKAQPLDRTKGDVTPGDDPRVTLAKWITDPSNEYFAGAMVNRVWKHYMSVGLVEPVDDLRATNPPTNPALWKALTGTFVQKKFDFRELSRTILLSRSYQLSSATRPGNEADARFYSHYYARRLPAEVLLDALCDATGVPERFDGYPVGVRAVQVPDPGSVSYFLKAFGRSDRVTACACERTGDVTLPQRAAPDRRRHRREQGEQPDRLARDPPQGREGRRQADRRTVPAGLRPQADGRGEGEGAGVAQGQGHPPRRTLPRRVLGALEQQGVPVQPMTRPAFSPHPAVPASQTPLAGIA